MIKKSVIVLVITLVVLFGGKYAMEYYFDNYTKMSSASYKEVKTEEEMHDIIDSNEVVYVYVGRPNCGDSDDFEEYFIDVMDEEQIDNLYFFNVKEISDSYEDSQDFKDNLKSEFDVQYTPTLAKYENGELALKSEWTPDGGYNKQMALDFVEESGILND